MVKGWCTIICHPYYQTNGLEPVNADKLLLVCVALTYNCTKQKTDSYIDAHPIGSRQYYISIFHFTLSHGHLSSFC